MRELVPLASVQPRTTLCFKLRHLSRLPICRWTNGTPACTRCFGSVANQRARLGLLLVMMTWDICYYWKASEEWVWRKKGLGSDARFQRTRTEFSVHGSRGGANSGDVGEYGRAETSSDDQPVCFDRGLRGGSGEAASAGGALAVRGNNLTSD